ncbi:MAG: hypothetical protein AAF311_13200 [Pseudomonadota bacterium]
MQTYEYRKTLRGTLRFWMLAGVVGIFSLALSSGDLPAPLGALVPVIYFGGVAAVILRNSSYGVRIEDGIMHSWFHRRQRRTALSDVKAVEWVNRGSNSVWQVTMRNGSSWDLDTDKTGSPIMFAEALQANGVTCDYEYVY